MKKMIFLSFVLLSINLLSASRAIGYAISDPVSIHLDQINPFTDLPSDHWAYTEIIWLYNQGIIQGYNFGSPDNTIMPENQIRRGDLSKVVCLAGQIPDFASDFPNPFEDLQNENSDNEWYYLYAKNLSYLEYETGPSPFTRSRLRFNGTNYIYRADLLKVILRTWNIPVQYGTDSDFPFTDVKLPSDPTITEKELFDYYNIYTAWQIGILVPNNLFRPYQDASRAEAFVLVYRMRNTAGIDLPEPELSDFHIPPGHLSLQSFNINNSANNYQNGINMQNGQFNHHTVTSFAINDVGIPLSFAHTYNSYTTSMPEELFPVRPMGYGWTHSYNSYLLESDNILAIHWSSGVFDLYDAVSLEPINMGVYNELTRVSNTKYTIKTKSQIIFTFEKFSDTASDFPFVLTEVKDRNNNILVIEYENAETIDTKRIATVTGTTGRTLVFSYYTQAGKKHLLKQVSDPAGRQIRFEYDENFDLESFYNAENNKTEYIYGEPNTRESHLLKQIKLPKGNIITNAYEDRKIVSQQRTGQPNVQYSFGYNDSYTGSTSSFTDQTSVTTTYTNNTNGNISQVTSPQSGNINISYDSNHENKPSSITENQKTFNYSYDSHGNLLSVTGPEGLNERYTYTALNDPATYTNSNNFTMIYYYEDGLNLTKVKDLRGNYTIIGRNPNGTVDFVTNPENITVNYTYDNYGNVETTTLPMGIVSTTNYDIISRPESNTNPKGQVTTFTYNNLDQLMSNTNVHQTTFTYDVNGNLRFLNAPQSQTTTYTYEFETDFLSSKSFGAYTTSYTYHADGLLATKTTPNGNFFNYTYDSQGRLTSYGDITLSYNTARDELISMTKDSRQITYTYDGLSRMKTSTDFWGNVITYDYDNAGNIIEIKYPGNKVVTYQYYADNSLKTVKDWNNKITTYTYRNDGQLNTISYPNGVLTSYSYDNAGRNDGYTTSMGGTVICSYQFVLDNLGQHEQVTINEPFANPNQASRNMNMSYDMVNRIITDGPNTYSFDNNGNQTSVSGLLSKTYTYDMHDQLVGIEGQGQNISYIYDAAGDRRVKVENGLETRYILDNNRKMSNVLMETDANGNVLNYYVYGLGLISRIKSNASTRYYHGDSRGSTIAMTDHNGIITHKYAYDSYGKVIARIEEDFNPFQYVGMLGVMYEAKDLYFMRARFYNPQIGRFMSEDPIWHTNLYNYAGNNPIMFVDPDGNKEYFTEEEWMFYTVEIEKSLPRFAKSYWREVQWREIERVSGTYRDSYQENEGRYSFLHDQMDTYKRLYWFFTRPEPEIPEYLRHISVGVRG